METQRPSRPNRLSATYTKQYCEENVWKLCADMPAEERRSYTVVFISNENKTVPFWYQSAGSIERKGFVVWDYHVILIDVGKRLIYDLDTTLSFPCPSDLYINEALRPHFVKKTEHADDLLWKFRIVPAPTFLRYFASDRSHMIRPDGSWLAPPPSYPAISTPGLAGSDQNSSLADTSKSIQTDNMKNGESSRDDINFGTQGEHNTSPFGKVLDIDEFVALFSS